MSSGVETVTGDIDSNKLTLTGKMDPLQVQEDLRRKTKKKVHLVSAPPNKGDTAADSGKDGKKSDDKSLVIKKEDKKSDEKMSVHDKKEKEASIVALKLEHYCQGCCPKIRRIVLSTNGVQEMAMDGEKEMVWVKGTMDVKVLMENLKERFHRPVELLSVKKEECSNGKDSENGIDDAAIEKSLMELKPQKTSTTMSVFKMPLHCDGCITRIRKIIYKIRGVQEVRINKKEETITVLATIDIKILTETMKKRLKKLVEEGMIEVQKQSEVSEAASLYSLLNKHDDKQQTDPPALLRFSEGRAEAEMNSAQFSTVVRCQRQSVVTDPPALPQFSETQSEIIQIISVQDFNEAGNHNQSPVSSEDVHIKIDSETRESPPRSETLDWAFLIASLVLEGVSAVLDQMNYLFVSMVLAFIALLLSFFELLDIAQRDSSNCIPCYYCHLNDNSPPSELFIIVHWFGLTSAFWQCLYSIFQYIYAHRHSDNPIRMTLLPFLFLLNVLISKLIRKMEEIKCQDLTRSRAKIEPQSDLHQSGDACLSFMEQNDQSLKMMESKIEVQSSASEPVGENVSFMESQAGNYGCSHYRRRCKIKAPCCNLIFDCTHCHNEVMNAAETSPRDRHLMQCHQIITVICYICDTEQNVRKICMNCGVIMGNYFCAKCKLFDDDDSKNQYHCDECGICRIGGRENFFHCKKCGSCYPKSTEDEHSCLENTM